MKKLISVMMVAMLVCGMAMATDTNDFTKGSTAVPAGLETPVILKGTCDFATTPVAASSVNKVITIPAGYIVQAVAAKMKVKESTAGAGTFTTGDLDAGTRYTTAALMTNTTTLTVSATASNKLYTSAEYIVVVPSTICATGTVEVSACVIPFK